MGQGAHHGTWGQEFWEIELANPTQQITVGSADDRASTLDREVFTDCRPRPPPGPLFTLEERHLKATPGEPPSGSQTGNSSAHHRDSFCCHAMQSPQIRESEAEH